MVKYKDLTLKQMSEADHSTQNQTVNTMIAGKSAKMVLFLVLVLVILSAVTAIQQFSIGGIENQIAQADQQIGKLKVDLETLQGDETEATQIAKMALDNLKKQEIRWSEVLANINGLVPKDASNRPKVRFLSYSGTADGKVNISAVTAASAMPPFNDVAQIISTFSDNVYFKEVYVPSISKGTNDQGQTTLSFILNLRYEPVDTGSDEAVNSAVSVPVKTNSTPAASNTASPPGVKTPASKPIPRTQN